MTIVINMRHTIVSIKGKNMRKKIIPVLLAILFSAFSGAMLVSGVMASSAKAAIASVSSAGINKDYISISDGFDGVNGRQWFSGRFLQTDEFRPNYQELKPEYQNNRSVLQAALNEYEWWYFRGTNCFRTLELILREGVSFAGITLHMTQDIHVSTIGIFRVPHWTIGTLTKPFNGIFDGNGYRLNIDRGIAMNADGYAGVFGAVNNAVIMNLTVTSQVNSSDPMPENFVAFNSASINAASCIGVVAASAVNSTVINCSSEVSLLGRSGTYCGAIVGKAVNATLINCIDKTSYCGGGRVYGSIEGTESKVLNCINYTAWHGLPSDDDRKSFVKEMNNNMLYFLRTFGKSSARYFWGIDGGLPLFNASGSYLIFDENVLVMELIVSSVLSNIEYYFADTCDFMTDEAIIIDGATKQALDETIRFYLYSDMYLAKYFGVLEDIEDTEWKASFEGSWLNALGARRIGLTDNYEWNALATIKYLNDITLREIDKLVNYRDESENGLNLHSFSLAIASLADAARDTFDKVYWTWAFIVEVEEANAYEKTLITFAKDTVMYLYHDTKDFMEEATQERLDVLKQMYDWYVAQFDALKMVSPDGIVADQTEYLETVLGLLDEAVHEFDVYYWDWFENTQLLGFRQVRAAELIEAYNSKLAKIPEGAYREKLERAKVAALTVISETEFSDWLSFAAELYTAVSEAQIEFEVTYSDYLESEQNNSLAFWIGGIAVLVIAGLAVYIVFLFKKNRTLVAIAYSTRPKKFDKKYKVLDERAQAIEEETKRKREEAEAVAKAQRERAQQLNLAVQLRKEKREEMSRLELEKYEKLKAEKERLEKERAARERMEKERQKQKEFYNKLLIPKKEKSDEGAERNTADHDY